MPGKQRSNRKKPANHEKIAGGEFFAFGKVVRSPVARPGKKQKQIQREASYGSPFLLCERAFRSRITLREEGQVELWVGDA